MPGIDGRPETLEERIVYWSLAGTWLMWAIGALYIVMPAMGWLLLMLVLARRAGLLDDRDDVDLNLPLGAWAWIVGMGLTGVALVVGHLELGLVQFLKSFMGWMKGWALIAVFVVIGAASRIRAQVLFRASNMLALQTLIIAPIMLVAGALQLPRLEFVSPLSVLGGSGPEYFTFQLYGLDLGQVRWTFYAPWSPAAGLVACVSLFMAVFDRNPLRRVIGVIAALVVIAMAYSRLSYVVIPVVAVIMIGLSNLTRPAVWIIAALALAAFLPFADQAIELFQDMQAQLEAQRADSTRVRRWLQSIAYHRWLTEAPIFGHGVVERGPHLVAFMPIGTHHSWYGLLFVKGAVGFIGLALPMAWSFVEMVAKAQADRVARAALAMLLVLFLYSFGENMETLIYLFWPAMLVVGIASRHRWRNPLQPPLGAGQEPHDIAGSSQAAHVAPAR